MPKKKISVPTIHYHLKKVDEDAELVPEATIRKFLIVQPEEGRQVQRHVEHYSLQAINTFLARQTASNNHTIVIARAAKQSINRWPLLDCFIASRIAITGSRKPCKLSESAQLLSHP
jgi:hypothetical protein